MASAPSQGLGTKIIGFDVVGMLNSSSFLLADCVVPGAGAFEIAVCDALDSFKNTVASRARLGVKVCSDLIYATSLYIIINEGYDTPF